MRHKVAPILGEIDKSIHKQCNICGEWKPKTTFHNCGKCNNCRARIYRQNHPLQVRAGWNRWSGLHPVERAENRRSADRLYRINNREKVNASAREYRKTIRPYTNLRKRLKGGAHIAELRNLIDSYLGRCVYCFEPLNPVTIDHIVPLIKGGTNDIENLVPACGRCNSSKNRNNLVVWLAKRAAYG